LLGVEFPPSADRPWAGDSRRGHQTGN